MAWHRVQLTAAEQEVVKAERESHPQSHVRRKMLVLWLLHCGLTRAKTATVACLGRATVQRYVAAYRDGGLDGLRQWNVTGPSATWRPSRSHWRLFTAAPVRTAAEAASGSSLDWPSAGTKPGSHVPERVGFPVATRPRHPGAAEKTCRACPGATEFLDDQLKPRLEEAMAGQGHVFFVDAAHFVFGTFLCCLWSFARLFVRAASGRQRLNVLGAFNAITRELIAVTNTTVVNTETMCELLRTIAARGWSVQSLWSWTTPAISVMPWCRLGQGFGERPAVLAVVLAEPESDRAALAVHETQGGVRPVSSDVRRLPSGHRGSP